MSFSNWPDTPIVSLGEARSLADEILGPLPGLQLKEPVLSKSSPLGDQAKQLKRELAPKAESGNAEAQFLLGTLYRYGTWGADGELRPDYAGAAHWYQQAAVGHLSEATYALGLLYRDGLGGRKDEPAAIRLFKEAAEAGNMHAMLALGTLYAMKGPGWGSYYLPWLKKAEEAGSAAASNELGVMSYEGALHEGRGFESLRQPQFDEAMKEFRKAAAGGDCDAVLNIGGMYFNGDGVPQDKNQARTWFLKEQGCKGATDGMRKEAAQFLAKLDNGQLPAVLTFTRPADTGKSAMSARDILLGALAVGLAAAVVHDMNDNRPPAERHKAFMELQDKLAEIEREKQKTDCEIDHRDDPDYVCY